MSNLSLKYTVHSHLYMMALNWLFSHNRLVFYSASGLSGYGSVPFLLREIFMFYVFMTFSSFSIQSQNTSVMQKVLACIILVLCQSKKSLCAVKPILQQIETQGLIFSIPCLYFNLGNDFFQSTFL